LDPSGADELENTRRKPLAIDDVTCP